MYRPSSENRTNEGAAFTIGANLLSPMMIHDGSAKAKSKYPCVIRPSARTRGCFMSIRRLPADQLLHLLAARTRLGASVEDVPNQVAPNFRGRRGARRRHR
jgi:hypothetical protein